MAGYITRSVTARSKASSSSSSSIQCPELPIEIWDKVASFLDNKTRLRGFDLTCKRFHYSTTWASICFSFESVSFFHDAQPRPIGKSQLAWLYARWSQVVDLQIYIHFNWDSPYLAECLSELTGIAQRWEKEALPKRLLFFSSEPPQTIEIYEGTLQAFLSAMFRKKSLEINTGLPICNLPASSSLQELHLCVPAYTTPLLKTFRELSNLTQLTMESSFGMCGDLLSTEETLQLEDLRQLRTVRLSMVHPWGLTLLQDCQLAIEIATDALPEDFYIAYRHVSVASLVLHHNIGKSLRQCLPRTLGKVGSILSVDLRICGPRTAQPSVNTTVELDATLLRRSPKLKILVHSSCTQGVCKIVIPRELLLTEFSFATFKQDVCLDIEDMRPFASGLHVLNVSLHNKVTPVCLASLVNLYAAANGKKKLNHYY